MRYFIELAYRGTSFFGWQRQPEQISVQETLEAALSTILNQTIEVVGCGRTDTGVHAHQYVAHFDFEGEFPNKFLPRINKFIGPDIALYQIYEVQAEAHARFDATKRSYQYHVLFRKDPFQTDLAYFFSYPTELDLASMQQASALLLQYTEFYPFCKSDTDANTMRCTVVRSEWEVVDDYHWIYHISADRFLRAMVRLVVGMNLNVGLGKITLETVKEALDRQSRLQQAQSAPPHGLYLTEVEYDANKLEKFLV